jgi:hypothetical protein
MTVLDRTWSPEESTTAFPQPAPPPADSPAVVAVVMDFVGATLTQFDEFLEGVRLKPGASGLPGSLFQWSRATPDGVRVIEVWRSTRHFHLFLRNVIAPRLSEAGLPEPEIKTYEVHSYLTQGPVVDPGSEDEVWSTPEW